MNFADLLTYADIDHLKRMASHYGCEQENHSKNGLITSLLYHLGGSSRLRGELDSLTPAQFRFLQLLCFDSRKLFSREDLLGKGRAAVDEGEESPRDLWILGLRKGWIFPGVTGRNRMLFEVPEDLRQRYLRLFAEMYRGQEETCEPAVYRDEEGLLVEDLHSFLWFLARQEVRLTRGWGDLSTTTATNPENLPCGGRAGGRKGVEVWIWSSVSPISRPILPFV